MLITSELPRPFCAELGCHNPCKKGNKSKLGFQLYSKRCSRCHKKKYKDWYTTKGLNRNYRNHLKDLCEVCGFVPEHICQLDVDHIDGDKSNTSEDNLQTMCANCHRLKTHLNKDWKRKTPLK